MPHSHHSHSGQFCGHAKNALQEVVQAAIAKRFHTFALTEHIPRPIEDFYPEEQDVHTPATLSKLFDDFIVEAVRLREVYSSKINILIGFETEWIRPSDLAQIQNILSRHSFDFFVGSVHHVHTCPIDFDRPTYEQARSAAGGTDELLFEAYFDAQFGMLQALKPPVVGHFDLIRLLSDSPNTDFKDMTSVWTRMQRNLEYVLSYGGLLELNSAALRKGLAQPYPCLRVCQAFLELGGGFVLSDDSHGVEQLGACYPQLLNFARSAGIQYLYFADKNIPPSLLEGHRQSVGFSRIAVSDCRQLPYWWSAVQ